MSQIAVSYFDQPIICADIVTSQDHLYKFHCTNKLYITYCYETLFLKVINCSLMFLASHDLSRLVHLYKFYFTNYINCSFMFLVRVYYTFAFKKYFFMMKGLQQHFMTLLTVSILVWLYQFWWPLFSHIMTLRNYTCRCMWSQMYQLLVNLPLIKYLLKYLMDGSALIFVIYIYICSPWRLSWIYQLFVAVI